MPQEAKRIRKIIKKGEKQAANELVSLYYEPIYAYVCKQTADEQLALDLTQDIFIAMLRSLPTFDGKKASFKTWLYKIATHRIVDYYRSTYYRYERRTEAVHDESIVTNVNDDFVEQLVQTEQVNEILAILNTYSADEQRIVRMKLFAEHTFREIGDSMGLAESTVKTKYYATLKRMRRRWEEGEATNGQA